MSTGILDFEPQAARNRRSLNLITTAFICGAGLNFLVCLIPEFQRQSRFSDRWQMTLIFSSPFFFLILVPALLLSLTLRRQLKHETYAARKHAVLAAFLLSFAPSIVGVILGPAWIYLELLPFVVFAIPFGTLLVRPLPAPGTCSNCFYIIRTDNPDNKCPECGTTIPPKNSATMSSDTGDHP